MECLISVHVYAYEMLGAGAGQELFPPVSDPTPKR